ncbi:MAG: type II toxin-antitoxin system VapC family toxin [Candidatus Hydrogenedentes bacterium]|nr:type II toxin-antitoxin system VapC family toxin [Candidatus Hydrogenedentota bacterium]
MRIVADTSTFLGVALEEPEKPRLIEITAGHELIAPDVLPFEVGNALTTLVCKGRLHRDQVTAVWDVAQRIPVELRRTDIRSALALAGRFGIHAYDAYFIECAVRLRAPLLTLDLKMRNVAKQVGVNVLEFAG